MTEIIQSEENQVERSSSTDVEVSRAAQEVQAMVIMAKRFPRDPIAAQTRILQACQRQRLAEESQYTYKRGNTEITGPSIRLAEVMAQNWGNIDFGIVELNQDRKKRESEVMAYAWDLETNARQSKKFFIPHERHTRKGTYPLTDPRDIYEMVANQGARRLRACILGIIPKDVQEEAVEQCNKTLSGNSSVPIQDKIKKMVSHFLTTHNVSQAMIESRIGHSVSSMSEIELAKMKKIATSLKDGYGNVEDYFNQKDDTTDKKKPKDGTKAALQAAKETEQSETLLPTVDELTPEIISEAIVYFLGRLSAVDKTWEKDGVALSIETTGFSDFVEPLEKTEQELWDEFLAHVREETE